MNMTKPTLGKRVQNKLSLWNSKAARWNPGVSDRTNGVQFLFIVTFGRTGSTLLQKLLCQLPGYYIAGENLDALYGLFQSYKACSTTKRKYGYTYVGSDHPWHGAHAMEPDVYGQSLVSAFVSSVLNPPRDARIVGFKEIRYLTHLDELDAYVDFMLTFFPDSRILINTRSAQATGKSGWWVDADQSKLAGDVALFDSLSQQLAMRFPDRVLRLNYEEWHDDPAAFKPLFDWLKVPFDTASVQEVLDIKLTHLQKKVS
jgi:Sulfotransferase family